jgi:hypothetical protein
VPVAVLMGANGKDLNGHTVAELEEEYTA